LYGPVAGVLATADFVLGATANGAAADAGGVVGIVGQGVDGGVDGEAGASF
jgi:hypothetical protein